MKKVNILLLLALSWHALGAGVRFTAVSRHRPKPPSSPPEYFACRKGSTFGTLGDADSPNPFAFSGKGKGMLNILSDQAMFLGGEFRPFTPREAGGASSHTRVVGDAPLPLHRWKQAETTTSEGIVVFGGDPLFARNSSDWYVNDTWILKRHTLTWQEVPAVAGPGGFPEARRSHCADTFRDESGNELYIFFGGKNMKKVLRNDVWALNLTDNVWSRLWPPPSTLDGPNAEGKHKPAAHPSGPEPQPRKGHACSVVNVSPPGVPPKYYLSVHGGRDDFGYFLDLWGFSLNLPLTNNSWENWTPVQAPLPAARDHHRSFYYVNRTAGRADPTLVIWSGRAGITWNDSRPVDDMYAFNFSARRWHEVAKPRGARPGARWLFGADEIREPSGNVLFHVFGGESWPNHYHNDLWQYDVASNTWMQLAPDRCRAPAPPGPHPRDRGFEGSDAGKQLPRRSPLSRSGGTGFRLQGKLQARLRPSIMGLREDQAQADGRADHLVSVELESELQAEADHELEGAYGAEAEGSVEVPGGDYTDSDSD